MNALIASTNPFRCAAYPVVEGFSGFNRKCRGLLAGLGFSALFLLSVPASAATAPALGVADSFAVLGATAITNTGPTVIIGDFGINPSNSSSVTGFPPGSVIGSTHYADGTSLSAKNDATTAFTTIDQPCDTSYAGGQDLGGLTLTPGVYCSASSFMLTGTLTLDAQNDPNAVWIFKMPVSTLTTATDSVVRVINGGQACNVFWRVGSSATLNTRTTFIGTIIANTSISMVGGGASLSGRALALTGAVTLNDNAVAVCSLIPPVGAGAVAPTVSKSFSPVAINTGGSSALSIVLSNSSTDTNNTNAAFTDTLPSGMVIATPSDITNTCGGSLTATPGAGSLSLSGGTIPFGSGSIPGTCMVSVRVTADVAGTYINYILANAVTTDQGSNAAPAAATLNAIAPVTVPTLSEWAMMLLASLLVIVGFTTMRRQSK